MKTAITVRKNKNRRIGICIFTVCFLSIVGFLIVCAKNAYGYIALLCTPLVLLSVVLLLYFETWEITFFSDRIIKKSFLFTMGSYSYYQIKDITVSHSFTEYSHIIIALINGKTISFRIDDDNANKAMARLSSHHSIRIIR